MAKYSDLATMTTQERERIMPALFDEAVRYRRESNRENNWLELYRMFRMVKDADSVHVANIRHPYVFSIVAAIQSALYPTFLSANPPFQIGDLNPANRDRNTMTEQIVAAQLQNPQRSNFRTAWDSLLQDVTIFGTAVPWINFRSEVRSVGPVFEPERLTDGTVVLGEDGRPNVVESYPQLRVYHGPHVTHIDNWDHYFHPDGNRSWAIRDTIGRELLHASQGGSPRYDANRVDRMLREEANRAKFDRLRGGEFSGGDVTLHERDELAMEAGAEPRRYREDYISSIAVKDVMGRIYPLYHYTDDQFSATYAVTKAGKWFELRFIPAAGPDGTRNIIPLKAAPVPQEVYGLSVLEPHIDLFKLQERMYQAMADGAALTVNPMWIMSEAMRQSNPEMVTGPGHILNVPTFGNEDVQSHVRRLDMPQTWVNASQFLEYIQGDLDQSLGTSELMRGQMPQGRRAATLVQQVAAAAEGRLKMIHERLAVQFGVPLVRKFMALNAVHLDREDYITYLGPHKARQYAPPSLAEIVESLSYIPKGSLASADSAMRAARWPQVITTMTQALPFLQLKPVNESFRRWLEDMGMDDISRLMPEATDQIRTEFMNMVGGQGGSPPASENGNSPTDTNFFADQMRASFGATAPPGPADGGRGTNGAQPGFAGARGG